MRKLGCESSELRAVETLLLDKFRSEPFHNLNLLYGRPRQSGLKGGTCSDKTLSFLSAAKQAGFDVALHTGFIGGEEIHRLARVSIGGRVFFADVGNGWPALRLYPADKETRFRCFGMGFRTEIEDSRVKVFHEKMGKESLQLEINVRGRPEDEIKAEIARRFSSGITYPFNNSLRFSLVMGERFLFLRGDRLEIYSDHGMQIVQGIEEPDVPEIILRHFGFDVGPLIAGSSTIP
ncbi:MAG: arylamine N-acetyltransferase [Alteromonadaceae bacterium]|nr:arylamine N-acetyltransferase [Alteromonadaceae bacterium]